MKYYKVYTMGTKDHVNVDSEEVAYILAAKGQGFEFIRVRNLFLNPKYITKIVPNDELNSSIPRDGHYLGKEDESISQKLIEYKNNPKLLT